MILSQQFGVIGFSLVLVGAQFAFTIDNTDADVIYNDIQAMWPDWAAAGNQVLGSAKEEYPDAWSQLAAIYGSTSLPVLFDAGLARTAASVLAKAHAETTIWDKNAGDHAQYTLGVREISTQSMPTEHTSVSSSQTVRLSSTTRLEPSTAGSSAVTSASDSSSLTSLTESSPSSAAATTFLNVATLGSIMWGLALGAAMLTL